MPVDYRTQQRATLRKALDQLARQYEGALMQSVNAIDASTRVQAEQQAVGIEQRMADLHERLGRLELAPPAPDCPNDPGRDPGAVHDLLRDHLHKIDFRQVEKAIRNLLDGDARAGRAGLLLFQRCGEMHGRLCAERILRILKEQTDSGNFRHLPVELRPADHNDPGALLRHLARHLGLDLAGRPADAQLPLVTRTLCESLQPGSIVLLDIGRCDYLTHDLPASLPWVVMDLWRRLLADLQSVAQHLPGTVTVIALLFFDGAVPDGALSPENCCSTDAFRRDRMLEIELRNWERWEVEDWLTNFGGLSSRPVAETRLLAKTIMDASRGIPSLIANELLQRCAAL